MKIFLRLLLVSLFAVSCFAQSPYTALRDFISAGDYSSFSAAVTAASNKTLLIAAPITVSASTTVPAGTSLWFINGGSLAIASGQTVTIDGYITAPDMQIFSGVGLVSFSGNTALSEVSAKWWGATGNGSTDDTATLQTAFVASTTGSPTRLSVRVPDGNYVVCNLFLGSTSPSGCPSTGACSSPARVYGQGGNTIFGAKFTATSACGGTGGDFVVKATSLTSFTLESIAINGGATTAGTGASCLDVSWRDTNLIAPAAKNLYQHLDLANCKDAAGSYAIDADQDNDSDFHDIAVGGPTSTGNQIGLSLLMGGGQTGVVSGVKFYNGAYLQADTQGIHIDDSYLTGGLVVGFSGATGGTSYNLFVLDNVQLNPNAVTGVEINGLKPTGSGSSVGNLICNECNFEGGSVGTGQAIFGGYWTTGAIVNGGVFAISTGGAYFASNYVGSAAFGTPVFTFNNCIFGAGAAPAASGSGYFTQIHNAYGALAATILNSPIAGANVLTYGSTTNTNAALGNHFRITLTGNTTLANPTSPVDGQKVTWELIQDATGSRTVTLGSQFAFGTDVTGYTATTTANKRDFIGAIYNASTTTWYVVSVVKGY